MVLHQPSDRFAEDDRHAWLRDRIVVLEAGGTFTLAWANATDFHYRPDHFSDAGTAPFLSVADGEIALNDPPDTRFEICDGIIF